MWKDHMGVEKHKNGLVTASDGVMKVSKNIIRTMGGVREKKKKKETIVPKWCI